MINLNNKIRKIINKIFGKLSRINFYIIKYIFIKFYIYIYEIDINEYDLNVNKYNTINDFFCRKFKKNSRNINLNKNIIISPVDGKIIKFGNVNNNSLFIKNNFCNLNKLIDNNRIIKFLLSNNSKFILIYLSPKNYHRVHMSYDSELKYMFYIPGTLYTVNPESKNYINSLYNERVICIFKNKNIYIIKILIGSIIVGGIETIWHGIVNINNNLLKYKYNNIFLKKGDEIARFNIGSTVLMIVSSFSNKLYFNNLLKRNTNIYIGNDIFNII